MRPRNPLSGLLAAGAIALGACQTADDAEALGPWESHQPTVARQTGRFADPTLTESSGAAASRASPGVIWTHNDSGHDAVLYATDTSGAARGRWAVPGASNVDWEEMALGPCPATTCLYIGDVGDNGERRASVTLYRVPEPSPATGGGDTVPAESLIVRYPDRPRDVEALYVDNAGDTWLVSKGRRDGIFLYRIPAAAWGQEGTVAELVDTLPLPVPVTGDERVTGAALSRDQRIVVVRTLDELYFFSRDSTGTLSPAPRPNRCMIERLDSQGEAVTWWDDSTLVLTSEAGSVARGTVHLVRCR